MWAHSVLDTLVVPWVYTWHDWLKTKGRVQGALLEDLSQTMVPRGLKLGGHTYSGTVLIGSRIWWLPQGGGGGGHRLEGHTPESCCDSPLQNMVMSFRVSDLQMLLGFVGRSKSGLKHELVTRALQLVQFDCSPELFKKIKELYETRYAKKTAEPGPQAPRPLDPLALHSMPRTPLSGPTVDYPVLYGKYLNGLGRLPTKTLKPEVRLVKLPFFNMLDELLKPTELGEWWVVASSRRSPKPAQPCARGQQLQT